MLKRVPFAANGTYAAGLNGSFKVAIENKTSVLQEYTIYIDSNGQRYTRSNGWISPKQELELRTFHLQAGDVLGYIGETSSLHAWVSILEEETAISAYGGKAEVIHAADGTQKQFSLPTGVAARSKDEVSIFVGGVKFASDRWALAAGNTAIELDTPPYPCAKVVIEVIRIA